MEKHRLAVSVRALGMYFAECDFGNAARSAFDEADKAAEGFLHKRTAAVPSKNLNRL